MSNDVTADRIMKSKGALEFALKARGFDFDGPYLVERETGVKALSPVIDWVVERGNSGFNWRRGPENGKYRVYVGEMGNKSCYRMRKDGTIRIDDMADEIIAKWKRRIAERKAEIEQKQKRKSNEQMLETLATERGVSKYSLPFEITYQHNGSIGISNLILKCNGISKDQAARILAILDENKAG